MADSMPRALRRLLPWLPFALVCFAPALVLVGQSFFPAGGGFSLEPYRQILGSDPGAVARRSTLWNSLLLALAVAGAALLAGVPFGFLVARTDLRLARFFEAIAIVPLLLPPYLSGIAWVQLHPMRGLWGCVFILTGALVPVVTLLSARAFREVGAEIEDAARLALGERRALLRVTLPLARGGVLAGALLVFVFALSDFVVPDFFSFAVPGEETFQVFATEIYGAFARQADPRSATAFAVPLVAIAGIALAVLACAEQRRDVASVAGSHAAPRPFRLGRARPLAQLYVAAVVAATALVPLAVLGQLAFKQGWDPRGPAWLAISRYGPDAVASLRDAAIGVVLLLLLAAAPARALARGPAAGPALLAFILLPLAFPSLLLGMAHKVLTLGPSPLIEWLHDGAGLVAITLAARFLPLAVLALAASWRRLSPELHDATALAPVHPLRRMVWLALPLHAPGFAAVGTLAFGLMLREFDAIVLLPGAQEMLTNRVYALVHQARDATVGALAWLQVLAVLVPWYVLRLLIGARRR